jgi:hypothetical protein
MGGKVDGGVRELCDPQMSESCVAMPSLGRRMPHTSSVRHIQSRSNPTLLVNDAAGRLDTVTHVGASKHRQALHACLYRELPPSNVILCSDQDAIQHAQAHTGVTRTEVTLWQHKYAGLLHAFAKRGLNDRLHWHMVWKFWVYGSGMCRVNGREMWAENGWIEKALDSGCRSIAGSLYYSKYKNSLNGFWKREFSVIYHKCAYEITYR